MKSRSAPSWTAILAALSASVAVSRVVVGATSLDEPRRDESGRGEAQAVKLAPAVTAAELEAHMRFLAADERKGRMTGSAEAEQCARYLAQVFEREGLAPAGDEGTFLERVPLVRTVMSAAPQLRLLDETGAAPDLAFGVDFNFSVPPHAGSALTLVHVTSKDDLPAAADPNVALFVDAGMADRKHWLEDAHLGRGAGFGLLLVPGGDKTGQPRELGDFRTIKRAGAPEKFVPSVSVHGPALARLRSGDIRKIDFDPHVTSEEIKGSNVVARIVGVGTKDKPELAHETLVVTAHYDHLDSAGHGRGKTPKPGEDVIYNGADDDASGVAAVLEIAGAMAHEKSPARTVVFVLVTGEEIGLLGTDEYLDHPAAPLKDTVANLNFEMIGRPDPNVGGAGHLWLTGFDLTNLGPAFAAAKLAILPDPYPKENFYERSDNIAFVHRGVVGQTLSSYNLHKDYHTPRDEVDKIDFAHMEGCTKAGLAAVQLIATGELTPAWSREPPKPKPKSPR